MSNKAQDYLNSLKKGRTLTLPSGNEFLVRKLNALWFAQNAALLPVGGQTDTHAEALASLFLDQKQVENNALLTRKMIVDGVIEPKVLDIPESDAINGVVALCDLDPEDVKFLVDYLLGLTDAGGQSVDRFPEQPVAAVTSSGS